MPLQQTTKSAIVFCARVFEIRGSGLIAVLRMVFCADVVATVVPRDKGTVLLSHAS